MPGGQDIVPPISYPASAHVWLQHSPCWHTPVLRATLDQHSCPSLRNWVPLAHEDWSTKPDFPHVGMQHSDCGQSSPQYVSVLSRMFDVAGHWLVPLESPESRHPDSQHVF